MLAIAMVMNLFTVKEKTMFPMPAVALEDHRNFFFEQEALVARSIFLVVGEKRKIGKKMDLVRRMIFFGVDVLEAQYEMMLDKDYSLDSKMILTTALVE